MITIYGSGPAYNTSDLSPFVVKAETYCKLAKIEYTKKSGNPRKAPKGKIPYMRDDDKVICDSSMIVEHLKKAYKNLDKDIKEDEQAISVAFKSMIEERYYFCLMYQRWQSDEGWAIQEPTFGSYLNQTAGVPNMLLGGVMRLVRSEVLKQLKSQGTGRHETEYVEQMGREQLDAISQFLGTKPYFFGPQPRSIDATVWAFLACTSGFPMRGGLTGHLAAKPNLATYVDRIRQEYWS